MTKPLYHNIDRWIQANKNCFAPPVCNKMMHTSQLQVFYVGGPNVRKDFHIEEGEELFYMKKGNMVLRVLNQGHFVDIPIKEGELFLLPSKVPHSPQRQKDTLGLVIERFRKPDEKECLRWYVEGSTSDILYERWTSVSDLGRDVANTIKDFFASEQYKTGRPIKGTITSNPPYHPNLNGQLMQPFSLREWLVSNLDEILEYGHKQMFGREFNTDVTVYGPGQSYGFNGLYEAFIWQLTGGCDVTTGNKIYRLQPEDTLLIPADTNYQLLGSDDSLTMIVKMFPNRDYVPF